MALLFAALPLLQVTAVLARKYCVKQQIARMRHKSDLTKLFIPVSEFNYIEAGDEIFWQNNEFDIIAVSRQGNYWEIAAIDDRIEHQLMKSLANHSSNNAAQNKIIIAKDWSNSLPLELIANTVSCSFIYPGFYVRLSDGIFSNPYSPPEFLG